MLPLYQESSLDAGSPAPGAFTIWEHPEGAPPHSTGNLVSAEALLITLPIATYAAIRELAARERDSGMASSAPSTLKRWLAEFARDENCHCKLSAGQNVSNDFRLLEVNSRRLSGYLRRKMTITVQADISASLFKSIQSYAQRDANDDCVAYLLGAIFQKTMHQLTGKRYEAESPAPACAPSDEGASTAAA